MPPVQDDDQTTKKRERRDLSAVIGKHILDVLGKPDDLQRVEVRRLWESSYRVNVLLGADSTSIRIAHRYFLVANEEGGIVTAMPPLVRAY